MDYLILWSGSNSLHGHSTCNRWAYLLFLRTSAGATALLGMWKETFASDLHWSLQYRIWAPPLLEPRKSELPSWSWLSMLPQRDGGFKVLFQEDLSLECERCAIDWGVTKVLNLALLKFCSNATYPANLECTLYLDFSLLLSTSSQ